ncbi:MAG: class I SAM-dependent methyltransferase [Eubacterium sp.]|nr:class I SAM-dependent methyltransferase [Eubacterium sp.]
MSELYQTSELRTNILRVLSFTGSERVLEVGAGSPVLTAFLAAHAKEIVCLDDQAERIEESARQNAVQAKIRYVCQTVTEYSDAEQFDLVLLADVDQPALSDWAGLLDLWTKPEGKVLLAVENPYGLRGFSGCREEQGASVWGQQTMRIRSLQQCAELFRKAGFSSVQTYYPYPDHLYTAAIYSDAWLPKTEELKPSMRNFTQPAVTLFDEQTAFGQILEEGNFPLFSNAYLLLASRKAPVSDRPLYVKCSNDRAPERAIITRIMEKPDGSRYVEKLPAGKEAEPHVFRLAEQYRRLCPIYEKAGLMPNVCEKTEAGMRFAWVEGKTLAEEREELRKKGKKAEADTLLADYLDQVQLLAGGPFTRTPAFCEVFGDVSVPEGMPSSLDGNIDLLPHNILQADGRQVIDYEWTFPFPVPLRFVLYRILYYDLHARGEEQTDPEGLYTRYGFTEEERALYAVMEQHFQQWLLGGKRTIDDSYLEESPGRFSLEETRELVDWEAGRTWMRVFLDGVCIRKENLRGKKQVHTAVTVASDVSELYIQPFAGTGILAGIRIQDREGRDIPWQPQDGLKLDRDRFGFYGREPQIRIETAGLAGKELTVSWQIISLTETDTAVYCLQFLEAQMQRGGVRQLTRLYEYFGGNRNHGKR